jgi:hypothetical protein
MKNLKTLVLLLVFTLFLAACGGSEAETTEPTAEPTAVPTEEEMAEEPTAEPTEEPMPKRWAPLLTLPWPTAVSPPW